ncbi:hypothetical protein SEA_REDWATTLEHOG_98 [Gordonia phage RedWattleHog]|uniref:Uncharacterized protein n=1 Tax=Gordonia phage Stormageddon TaxID=2656541 RepID=A0A649VR29_9CAUD|nr:hypothetical protein KHQ86_gp205 [Gordonia phage Stormageddon]QGJ94957.1 hypothetical protein SEA_STORMAGEDDON_95 [Gordonia phage Stormageddon]QLF83601.1 hypothetical protein SEA_REDWATTLEHOG_98 [Gordonia phage RedWattleHog]
MNMLRLNLPKGKWNNPDIPERALLVSPGSIVALETLNPDVTVVHVQGYRWTVMHSVAAIEAMLQEAEKYELYSQITREHPLK